MYIPDLVGPGAIEPGAPGAGAVRTAVATRHWHKGAEGVGSERRGQGEELDRFTNGLRATPGRDSLISARSAARDRRFHRRFLIDPSLARFGVAPFCPPPWGQV